MNFIEKNSKKNPFIEIRKAKQFGYSQIVAGQFLSSKYHPKQEADRLITAAINAAANAAAATAINATTKTATTAINATATASKDRDLASSGLASSGSTCLLLLGVFPLDTIALSITHTSAHTSAAAHTSANTPAQARAAAQARTSASATFPPKNFFFEANDISTKDYSQALSTLFKKELSHFDLAAKKILGSQEPNEANIEKIAEKISHEIKKEEALKTFLKNLSKEELDNLIVVKSTYAKKEKIETALEIILNEKMQRRAEKQTTKKFEWVWQWNKISNHRLLKKSLEKSPPEKSPLEKSSLGKSSLGKSSLEKSPPEKENIFWIDNFSTNNTPNDWNNLKDGEEKKLFQQTALFVAAGPSVDQHLDNLSLLSYFFPIFIVPGVTKLLLKNKVTIKGIISTDPGYYQNLHFQKSIEAIKNHKQQIPLIAPLSCHAMSVRQYAKKCGNVFFYIDDWKDCENLIKIIEKQITADPGPNLREIAKYISSVYTTHDASVSLSALRLLHRFNYKQIVLLGFDFASDGFAIHSKGYSLEENYFTKANRLNPFESFLQKSHPNLRPINKGQWSYESWMLYAKHFDQLSENLRKEGLTVQHFSQFIEENKKIIDLLKKEKLKQKKVLIFDNPKYNLNSKQHKKDRFSFKDYSKYIIEFFDRALKKTIEQTIKKSLEESLQETDALSSLEINSLEKKVKRYFR